MSRSLTKSEKFPICSIAKNTPPPTATTFFCDRLHTFLSVEHLMSDEWQVTAKLAQEMQHIGHRASRYLIMTSSPGHNNNKIASARDLLSAPIQPPFGAVFFTDEKLSVVSKPQVCQPLKDLFGSDAWMRLSIPASQYWGNPKMRLSIPAKMTLRSVAAEAAPTKGSKIAAGRANLRFTGINSGEIFQADFMRPESCSSFKAASTVS